MDAARDYSLSTSPKYRSFLFYGPPGSGKTWASMDIFPSLNKFVIDTDNKLAMSLECHPRLAEITRLTQVFTPTHRLSEDAIGFSTVEAVKKGDVPATVKGTVPKNAKGYMEIVNFLNNDLSTLIQEHNVEVVVLDTLSAISDHLIYRILETHMKSSMTLPLWGIYRNNLNEFVKGFLGLPCHRIVCAHTNVREDEVTKEVHVRPSIMGSYRDDIAKEFVEAWHFEGLRGSDYMVRTAGTSKYMARTAKKLEPIAKLSDVLKNFDGHEEKRCAAD